MCGGRTYAVLFLCSPRVCAQAKEAAEAAAAAELEAKQLVRVCRNGKRALALCNLPPIAPPMSRVAYRRYIASGVPCCAALQADEEAERKEAAAIEAAKREKSANWEESALKAEQRRAAKSSKAKAKAREGLEAARANSAPR